MKKFVVIIVLLLIGCAGVQDDLRIEGEELEENEQVEEPQDAPELIIEKDEEKTIIRTDPCSEPLFNSPPVNLDQIGWIVPLGLMSGNHVTPVDHQYYQAAHDNQIEVTNPGDGVVTHIERMGSVEEKRDDWRLIIKHDCNKESIYIHIDKLSDKLMEHIPVGKRSKNTEVNVKEGEIIGWYDNNVDYNVVDYDIEIGLINKESFAKAEDWKIHVQDPFLYFNDEIKARMIQMSLRSEEPYGGKIDYDLDGTLIGIWFEEGTNGYAGKDFPAEFYHQGHLAIAPNHIDPSYTMVSVGRFEGGMEGYQFGVGNIDASTIGVGEEVTWGLFDFQYELDGVPQQRWGVPKGSKVVNGRKKGAVRFKLVEQRRLEADFGDGVRYYVR